MSNQTQEKKKQDKEEDNELNQHILTIIKERKYVDIKPFSHNIISLELNIISKKYGKEKANQVIKNLNLEKLGWYIYEKKNNLKK